MLEAVDDAEEGVIEPDSMPVLRTELRHLTHAVARLETAVSDGEDRADKRFVTKEEFAPVRAIVYGLVALILTAVFGALIALVVLRGAG